MIDIKHIIDDPENEVCIDEMSKHDKAKVMREQHKTSRFFSIAETFQFISAVMLPVAMGVLVGAVKVPAAGAGVGAMFTAVGAAMASPAVIVFLSAAAICTAVAIGARYIASHHLHNATYNSSELNAQHTAKYLAKEIEKTHVQEHEQNARADGKQWAQVMREQVPASQQAR